MTWISNRLGGLFRKCGFLIVGVFILLQTQTGARTAVSGLESSSGNDCQYNKPKRHDQRHRRFNPEKFKKDLSEYITKEAGLSKDEAKRLLPVFFEMKDKMRSIEGKKNHALLMAAGKNLSEKDYERVLNEVDGLNAKACRTEHDYLQKMRKCVGVKKTVKVLAADKKFGRRMFRQMTGERK